MKKKAVIFDMDGLMFDTQCIYDKAFDEIAMKLFRFEMSREMHLALMGRSGQDMIDTAARYLPEGADAEAFIRRTFDLVAELVKTELRARPGLDTILTYLSDKGYPIGLASGSDRKIVNSNLESAGIGHYFAATLCGRIYQGCGNDRIQTGGLLCSRRQSQWYSRRIQGGLRSDHGPERCRA